MYNIQKIETLSKDGHIDIYNIVDLVEKVVITHNFTELENDKEESERKTLSAADFRPIADAFENLDYTQIFKESDNLPYCDCSYLTCEFVSGKSSVSLSLYCKLQDTTVSEISKLFDACKMVFDLFPVEKKIINKE